MHHILRIRHAQCPNLLLAQLIERAHSSHYVAVRSYLREELFKMLGRERAAPVGKQHQWQRPFLLHRILQVSRMVQRIILRLSAPIYHSLVRPGSPILHLDIV